MGMKLSDLKENSLLKLIVIVAVISVLLATVLGISVYCTYRENSDFKGKITDAQISEFRKYFVPYTQEHDDFQMVFYKFEFMRPFIWCPILNPFVRKPNVILDDLIAVEKDKYPKIIDYYILRDHFTKLVMFREDFHRPWRLRYKNCILSRIGKIFMRSYVSDMIKFEKLLIKITKNIRKGKSLVLRVSGNKIWFQMIDKFTDDLIFYTSSFRVEDAVEISNPFEFLSIFLLRVQMKNF